MTEFLSVLLASLLGLALAYLGGAFRRPTHRPRVAPPPPLLSDSPALPRPVRRAVEEVETKAEAEAEAIQTEAEAAARAAGQSPEDALLLWQKARRP